MSWYYVLAADGKTPVPVPDVVAWAAWFETADRRVAQTTVNGARVSTVFLGLDHGVGDREPILWETMIFGGPHDGWQRRYVSYQDALDGHAEAVAVADRRAIALDLVPDEE